MSRIVAEQVITLFLIMAVGFYAKKKNIISGETSKRLSDILFKITMPLLIISSFQIDYSADMLKNIFMVLFWAFAVHIISVVVALFLYYKCPVESKKVLKFAVVFSNCGYMGFPVLESIVGSIGIFYGAVFLIPFNVFLWSYGVMVFNDEKQKGTVGKVLTNPGIIAVALGMVLFMFSIKLPMPVFRATQTVGSMTTPLSMIIVGALMADIKLKDMFKGIEVYKTSAVRLLILPLVMYGIMRLLNVPDDVATIILILTAMPVAANTAIFAEQFDSDAGLASRCIGISTLLSILTIPLIMNVLLV